MTMLRALPMLVLLAISGCGGNGLAPQPSVTVTAPTVNPSPRSEEKGTTAFLAALTAAGIPVSTSSKSELLIGAGVCRELKQGVQPEKLARDLTSAGYTRAQGMTVVSAAQQHLC